MKNFVELKANVLHNAILVSILIVYGLFGAFVFRKFEAQNSASIAKKQHESSKEQLLKELWNHRNLEFDQWSTRVRDHMDSYEKNFASESTSSAAEWSLSYSWSFACTVFTTIGYGSIIPVSMFGRVFCILYGLIGIPLFSVVMSSLASLITGILQVLHSAYLRRRRQHDAGKQKKDDDSSDHQTAEEVQEFQLTLTNAFGLAAAYLAVGAVLFSLWEEWSLFESFFFCFSTLTTLGLGDYVPQNIPHTVLYGGYILLGLALVTMLFSAMEEKIADRFEKIKQMVGLPERGEEKKEL